MPNYSQGIQGAAGGAMAGGSLGGAPGAIIGGGLGLLGGLFGGGGGDEYRNRLAAMEQEFANRHAPQVGQAGQAGMSDFRGNQAALIAQLEALSRGQGPSLAANQMREAMDRSVGAQASLAAGAAGRGVGQGAALRNASNQTAAIQSQGSRDTGMMRVQEQLGALQQLGLNIHGARGADESMNRFNTSSNNQFALANLDAQLRAMGMNDAARLQALQSAMGGAGPGMGSQILAGGAQAFAGMQSMNAAGQQAPGGGYHMPSGGPQGRLGGGAGGGAGAGGYYQPGDYGTNGPNPGGPSGQGGPIDPYA